MAGSCKAAIFSKSSHSLPGSGMRGSSHSLPNPLKVGGPTMKRGDPVRPEGKGGRILLSQNRVIRDPELIEGARSAWIRGTRPDVGVRTFSATRPLNYARPTGDGKRAGETPPPLISCHAL